MLRILYKSGKEGEGDTMFNEKRVLLRNESDNVINGGRMRIFIKKIKNQKCVNMSVCQ